VLAKSEAIEVRRHRRDRAEGRGTFAFEIVGGDEVLVGVARQRGDDPVELTGTLELADLAEAQQRLVGLLAVDADRLDEGQVGVLLVAPPTNRPLYMHTAILRC